VVATFDDVEPAVTQLIADRVVVLSYGGGEADFSQSGAVLRLGLSDGQIASDIITAAQTGEISIIGVTGAVSVRLPEVTTR